MGFFNFLCQLQVTHRALKTMHMSIKLDFILQLLHAGFVFVPTGCAICPSSICSSLQLPASVYRFLRMASHHPSLILICFSLATIFMATTASAQVLSCPNTSSPPACFVWISDNTECNNYCTSCHSVGRLCQEGTSGSCAFVSGGGAQCVCQNLQPCIL